MFSFQCLRIIRKKSRALLYEKKCNLKRLKLSKNDVEIENINKKYNHLAQVVVKTKYSSINPSDLNLISGTYPMSSKVFPDIGGIGSVGIVEKILKPISNSRLKIGDSVAYIRCHNCNVGAWQSKILVSESNLIKIPENVSLIDALFCLSGPITAYLMLHNFIKLQSGDLIIQNGANSQCGIAIIELAKYMGLKSINLIRRHNAETDKVLVHNLYNHGADHVFHYDEIIENVSNIKKLVGTPKLAFNCISSDESTLSLIKMLDENSKFITYGGMSRQTFSINPSIFIFKNISLCGFWLTQWRKDNLSMIDGLFSEMFHLKSSYILSTPKYQSIDVEYFDNVNTFYQNYHVPRIYPIFKF
ncbi:hypothetical protein A3Q56_03448 [Intoshia linei]|uniref:Enoyl-[acyl-carrier-protein] reductase, mitochondrial n=1 Tax=Intoshia linei TaxID=1819745 RepID=A0A177B3R9_9BILA|nr:hypothetical protein A3Q56_03448 [Intoshia linei]